MALMSKAAIVTGAAQGIGKAIAARLVLIPLLLTALQKADFAD